MLATAVERDVDRVAKWSHPSSLMGCRALADRTSTTAVPEAHRRPRAADAHRRTTWPAGRCPAGRCRSGSRISAGRPSER